MWQGLNTAEKTGFCQSTAHILARASSQAYVKDVTRLKQEWAGEIDVIESGETSALLLSHGRRTIIAFRGTESDKIQDWFSDLDVRKTDWDKVFRIHNGFAHAYSLVARQIRSFARDKNQREVIITGHSLGGALATVAAWDLESCGLQVNRVYTFGAPRVCSWSAASAFNKQFNCRFFRVYHNNDLVPRIPSGLRFRHVGMPIYINRNLGYEVRPTSAQVWLDRLLGFRFDMLRDHSMTNYIMAFRP